MMVKFLLPFRLQGIFVTWAGTHVSVTCVQFPQNKA